ncbi:hypothetical protein ACP70R_021571 [Stipagrostis hirtigluma subsp. patula]
MKLLMNITKHILKPKHEVLTEDEKAKLLKEHNAKDSQDTLLALDPLNKDHVIRINKAEAEYFKKSECCRMGWHDEILGFDCVGQHWVSETCFSCSNASMEDLGYTEEMLQLIEKGDIPAPAPIDYRAAFDGTTHSKRPVSPASSSGEIFSCVQGSFVMHVLGKHGTRLHRESEVRTRTKFAELQTRLRKCLTVDTYNNKAHMDLDPNKFLSSANLEKLFPVLEPAEHLN